ncbi:HAD family hydrolase [Methylibium rhizosphaerae]|uniref:HAD family hydrolase n=1 Tax=Methylibium rhizosphaerae TaxID=2570323 RepID=UPI00112D4671|nr:HAD family hydrolase [Methylibium rhizosphaerae]
MDSPARKVLVLDLDETLVHARELPLERDEDFRVGPYFVYQRPHLASFIGSVAEDFDLAVWTASGETYAAQVIERIFPVGLLKFVWSSRRCTTARDWTTGHYTTIKNLSKLKKQGYRLENIIAVDDTASKYARSYGNLVTVREFVGDPADAELPLLARYLRSLLHVDNVRSIEKRHWRQQVASEVPAGVA